MEERSVHAEFPDLQSSETDNGDAVARIRVEFPRQDRVLLQRQIFLVFDILLCALPAAVH